jgi:predicted nucleic-acid-binding Zn-ribbon protein
MNKLPPVYIEDLPKHIDVYQLARPFGFITKSLDALAGYFDVGIRKLTRREFNGEELWDECEAGNKRAWKEMARYNTQDVLVLEAVYNKIKKWTRKATIHKNCKKCGVNEWTNHGFAYKNNEKYQKIKCGGCGHGEKVKL